MRGEHMFVCLCVTDTHKPKKKGKKKLTFHLLPMKEKKTRCWTTRPGSIQSPTSEKKTRDYETRSDDSISPERESRLVPNDSPSRREERRLDFGFFFKARPAAVNDFRRRRFFFSRGVCVSLEGKRKSFSSSLRVSPEKSTKTRAV
jgi:hypothetical protein